LPLLRRVAQQYGDVVHLGRRWYLVVHPDVIQQILVEQPHVYHKGPHMAQMRPLIGNGLPLNEGDAWRRQRRAMQPIFHTHHLAAFVAPIVEATLAMMQRWEAYAQRGQPFDLAAELNQCTLDIIIATVFGSRIATDETIRIGQAFATVLEVASFRSRSLVRAPLALPTPQHQRLAQALRMLDQTMRRLIGDARTGRHAGDTFLGLLTQRQMNATVPLMTDAQVRDELMTLVIAGHETTAIGLTWILALLAAHPSIEAQLCEEAQRVLNGALPTFADLPDLSTGRGVIDEGLRLYPPAWGFMRTPLQNVALGGYHIPARSTLLISPYITQRDARFWPQPDQFLPDRFTTPAPASRIRGSYLPFGDGPRVCIGARFALMEMQLMLAIILTRYQFQLQTPFPIPMQPLFTLRPREGVWVLVQRRPVAATDRHGESAAPR
jgi:cytochrome P450